MTLNDRDVAVQRLLVRERSREPLRPAKREQLIQRLRRAAELDADQSRRFAWLTENLGRRLALAFGFLLLVAGGAVAVVMTRASEHHLPAIAPARKPQITNSMAPTPVPPTQPSEELLPSSALRAEVALIAGARRALASGNLQAGSRMLSSHAQRFPAGTLIEEREGLGIMLLWRQGQKADARKGAQRFAQQYPQSPMNQPIRELINDARTQN